MRRIEQIGHGRRVCVGRRERRDKSLAHRMEAPQGFHAQRMEAPQGFHALRTGFSPTERRRRASGASG